MSALLDPPIWTTAEDCRGKGNITLLRIQRCFTRSAENMMPICPTSRSIPNKGSDGSSELN